MGAGSGAREAHRHPRQRNVGAPVGRNGLVEVDRPWTTGGRLRAETPLPLLRVLKRTVRVKPNATARLEWANRTLRDSAIEAETLNGKLGSSPAARASEATDSP